MSRNMILRLGVDASDFKKKMEQAGASAESTGRRIKKSMSVSDLAEVSKIMGWSGSGINIGSINAGNIDAALSQLGTLKSYRDQLAGAGFDDYHFGLISERIKVLEYDLNEYTQSLHRAAEAEREASREADNLGDEAVKTVPPISKASRSLREMESSGRRLNIVPGFIRQIGESAGNSNNRLGRMVRTIRNVAVVSFGLRIARGLFGELGTIMREYISQNDVLQGQVNGLKAGMGQSLAPAIGLVTNALSYLLPYALGVSNAIGQLMGALFGSGWSAAAAGANKAAAATGGAARAQKEMNRQLMSFDQINRMESQKDTSAGGGGAGTVITPIEAKTPAWLERFKSSFSELFNSDEFKGSNIGGKIGMAIQTGIDWLATEAGNINWRGVGMTLHENFSALISSIDWGGSLQSIGRTLGEMFGGLFSPIWADIKEGWRSFSEQLAIDTEQCGGDALAGFLLGILRGVANIGRWLWQNLIQPVIAGVKEGFGIHSPSTVFADIGESCMSGLANGFTSGMQWIQQKLEDLRNKVQNAAATLKNAFSFDWKLPHLRIPLLSVQWDPVDNVLAKFFGVTAFPRMSVDWHAKGFITNGTSVFNGIGIGERGREALLPLDSYDGWKDEIAQRIAMILQSSEHGDSNLTVNFTLDGDMLVTKVIKGIRKYSKSGAVTL